MTVTTPSEPPDKLDTPPRAAVVNGPAGEDLDWHAIIWRAVEDDVRRLRQRIFTASQAGDRFASRSGQADECLVRAVEQRELPGAAYAATDGCGETVTCEGS